MRDKRHLARMFLWSVPLLALLIQLVPYGRSHKNPPVVSEAPWNSPRTKALFIKACGDCHSNLTAWPWYSSVAPLSWILQRDVEEGRAHLNVTEYVVGKNRGGQAVHELEEDQMPPSIYTSVHPSARLTPSERAELLRGLEATFGSAR